MQIFGIAKSWKSCTLGSLGWYSVKRLCQVSISLGWSKPDTSLCTHVYGWGRELLGCHMKSVYMYCVRTYVHEYMLCPFVIFNYFILNFIILFFAYSFGQGPVHEKPCTSLITQESIKYPKKSIENFRFRKESSGWRKFKHVKLCSGTLKRKDLQIQYFIG